MSLDAFAQSCNVTSVAKSIFPYEKWTEINQLIDSSSFPAYGDFKSSLKKMFDEKLVLEFYEVVNDHFRLGKWNNLTDIESYYGFEIGSMAEYFCIDTNAMLSSVSDESVCYIENYVHTSPKKYELSKHQFKHTCFTMLDYLREYNLMDCRKLFNFKKKFELLIN